MGFAAAGLLRRCAGRGGPAGSLWARGHHRLPGGSGEGKQEGDGQPQQEGKARWFLLPMLPPERPG